MAAITPAQQSKYRRQKHWIQLKELGYIGASLAQINSIERTAHKIAEDYCNVPMTEALLNTRMLKVTERVEAVFGGSLPDNFFINMDPRGYALKINQEGTGVPLSYQDMGGYGILAPEDL